MTLLYIVCFQVQSHNKNVYTATNKNYHYFKMPNISIYSPSTV